MAVSVVPCRGVFFVRRRSHSNMGMPVADNYARPYTMTPVKSLPSSRFSVLSVPFSLAMPDRPHQAKVYSFADPSVSPSSFPSWMKEAKDERGRRAAPHPFITKTGVAYLSAHQNTILRKLNQLIYGTSYADMSIYELVQKTCGNISQAHIHQYASQAWNMDFFLSGLASSDSPSSSAHSPSVHLAAKATSAFGSVDAFKQAFENVAEAFFGSGWVWLVETNQHELRISSTLHGGCPLVFTRDSGDRPVQWPVLGLSLWENAYMPTHSFNKAAYVKNFWRAINWNTVDARMGISPSPQNTPTTAPNST